MLFLEQNMSFLHTKAKLLEAYNDIAEKKWYLQSSFSRNIGIWMDFFPQISHVDLWKKQRKFE